MAPCNSVGSIVGNSQDVFPLIQLGEQFPLEFGPSEREGTGFGLWFVPFLMNTGEENTIPDFLMIKRAISDTFNNMCLIKMKKKFSTWKVAIVLGSWE